MSPEIKTALPPDTAYEEKELLQDLRSGKEAAFAAIYEKYAPSLVDFTASRLASLDEAKDIIQDIFVFLWEERANIHITHSLRAFLFAVARYRIVDHIRHSMTREKYADKLLALPAIESETESHLAAKDLQQRVEEAVNELPQRVREVYRLSRDKHYSIAEIAAELNISPQTVKNQLTTALSHLRSLLKKLSIFLIGW